MSFKLIVLVNLLVSYRCVDGLFTKLAKTTVRYLESNSWGFTFGDFKILLDPVMSSPLVFGLPELYSGKKKVIDGPSVLDEIVNNDLDYIFITQGFEDHAHTPTLKYLAKNKPNISYICPPSASKILESCGIKTNKIKTILPGEKLLLKKKDTVLELIATIGAVLGPPWQQPENGYIIRPAQSSKKLFPSLYTEPHCMYDGSELSRYQVDNIITPVVSQILPGYTLIEGGQKALKLAKILKAKAVIPMMNGDLNQSGILARLLKTQGTIQTFENLVKSTGTPLKVLNVSPGEIVAL